MFTFFARLSEYAGEIKDEWPVRISLIRAGKRNTNAHWQTKNLTIVHSRDLLLNDVYPDRWRRQVNESLQKRGVRLVLGDRVDDVVPKDGKIVTRSGKEIPADLVVS